MNSVSDGGPSRHDLDAPIRVPSEPFAEFDRQMDAQIEELVERYRHFITRCSLRTSLKSDRRRCR